MAADVNLGSPTRNPGSDEIHNFGGVLAEGETMVVPEREGSSARDRQYRIGYRDGFHDANEAKPDEADKTEPSDQDDKPHPRRIWLYVLGGLLLLALIVGGVLYWLHARHYKFDGRRIHRRARRVCVVADLGSGDRRPVRG